MIVRSPRPRTNFTVLDNGIIRNHNLSWKARGLLAYLLSLPDGWRTNAEHLARLSPQGRDAVRTGLAELEHHGYLRRRKARTPDGKVRTITTIYDRPQPVDNPDQPAPGFPTPVNPAPYEELQSNDVWEGLDVNSSSDIHTLADCVLCDGTGWRPTAPDRYDLERCTHA